MQNLGGPVSIYCSTEKLTNKETAYPKNHRTEEKLWSESLTFKAGVFLVFANLQRWTDEMC